MKVLFAILAFLLCAELAAQQMFKCKDASGRITYSGSECKDLGLSSAGEVKGQANVVSTPGLPPTTRDHDRPPPTTPNVTRQDRPVAQDIPAAEAAPGTPERRCFTVKTAKGTATRCNDTPPPD